MQNYNVITKIYITASLCQLVPREIFRDSLSNILGTCDLSSVPGSAALHQSFPRLKPLKILSQAVLIGKCPGTEHQPLGHPSSLLIHGIKLQLGECTRR